jgi:hypothetical protein
MVVAWDIIPKGVTLLEATLFASLFNWATSGIAGNLAYDGLKKLTQSFVKRFKRIFGSEEVTNQYYDALCKAQAKNPDKPFRDVEDLYEEILKIPLQEEVRTELLAEVKSWMNDHKEIIINLRTHQHDNEFRMNIGSQQAKNIVNIQGNANVNEIK